MSCVQATEKLEIADNECCKCVDPGWDGCLAKLWLQWHANKYRKSKEKHANNIKPPILTPMGIAVELK